MAIPQHVFPSASRRLLCLVLAFIGYFISYAPIAFANSGLLTLPEFTNVGQYIGAALDVASRLLLKNAYDIDLIGPIIVSLIVGFAVGWYSKNPAFPWQAERFRARAFWIALAVVSAGLLYPIVSASSIIPILILNKVFQALLGPSFSSAFLASIMWVPVTSAIGCLLAYIAGLHLYSHIGIRWIAPSGAMWAGHAAFSIVRMFGGGLGLDSIVGAVVGRIINSLALEDRHE